MNTATNDILTQPLTRKNLERWQSYANQNDGKIVYIKSDNIETKITKIWLTVVALITFPFTLVSSVINGIFNRIPILMMVNSIYDGISHLCETVKEELAYQNDGSISPFFSSLQILKCAIIWKMQVCENCQSSCENATSVSDENP